MSKREQNKEERKNKVIEAAKMVFEIKGIEATKMTDIADASNIGVASVYRYFSTKADVAIEVGIKYWSFVYDYLTKHETTDLSGLEGLKKLMNVYTDDDHQLTNFFRFIEQLDALIFKLEAKPENFDVYERAVESVEPIFDVLLERGALDGSIRSDIDVQKTYVMISHTLTALKQKHCSRGLILSQDTESLLKEEMKFSIHVFVNHLLPVQN